MSNPTRKEVEQIKKKAKVFAGASREQEVIWLCDFAIRALDMRDAVMEEVKWHLGSGPPEAIAMQDALKKALEKFDGGGDE